MSDRGIKLLIGICILGGLGLGVFVITFFQSHDVESEMRERARVYE